MRSQAEPKGEEIFSLNDYLSFDQLDDTAERSNETNLPSLVDVIPPAEKSRSLIQVKSIQNKLSESRVIKKNGVQLLPRGKFTRT